MPATTRSSVGGNTSSGNKATSSSWRRGPSGPFTGSSAIWTARHDGPGARAGLPALPAAAPARGRGASPGRLQARLSAVVGPARRRRRGCRAMTPLSATRRRIVAALNAGMPVRPLPAPGGSDVETPAGPQFADAHPRAAEVCAARGEGDAHGVGVCRPDGRAGRRSGGRPRDAAGGERHVQCDGEDAEGGGDAAEIRRRRHWARKGAALDPRVAGPWPLTLPARKTGIATALRAAQRHLG